MFRFIIVFGATMHWSCSWQNYNVLFTVWFCLHSILRKIWIFFIFFKMKCLAQHFTVFCIKYFFRKTHSTFLHSTYNSYVFLKKSVNDFNTSVQTIHGNVSSIKCNLLFCSNNKICDLLSSWTYVKWSITNCWFTYIWSSFICIREACIVQWF